MLPVETRLPDDHPARRDLRPLGFECVKWLRAMKLLQARLRKGRLGEPLTAFLSTWMPEAEVNDTVPEQFDLLLTDEGLASPELPLLGQPVCQALLHLPALRDFWTAELRASAYAHLLKIVPPAWCMDPTPLPPGSVIAGLEIVSWDDLPQCESQGRRFIRHPLGQNQVVLTETSAISEGWRARYALRDGEITLQEAFALPFPSPSAGPNV